MKKKSYLWEWIADPAAAMIEILKVEALQESTKMKNT